MINRHFTERHDALYTITDTTHTQRADIKTHFELRIACALCNTCVCVCLCFVFFFVPKNRWLLVTTFTTPTSSSLSLEQSLSLSLSAFKLYRQLKLLYTFIITLLCSNALKLKGINTLTNSGSNKWYIFIIRLISFLSCFCSQTDERSKCTVNSMEKWVNRCLSKISNFYVSKHIVEHSFVKLRENCRNIITYFCNDCWCLHSFNHTVHSHCRKMCITMRIYYYIFYIVSLSLMWMKIMKHSFGPLQEHHF